MKIFSGSANKPLAEKVAKLLHTSLSPVEIHVFPDREKRVTILENVVGYDTVIIQPTAPPTEENYMELFFLVDAVKRTGAKSATVVIPYLGYQRQDHVFRSGEAVSLDVVAKTIQTVGVDKVITLDLHSVKIPEVFTIPVVHLSALSLFAKKIKEEHGEDNASLVSPDMGGIRRIKLISETLDIPFAAVEKNRDVATGDVAAKEVHGELRRRAFIVDDMISSGKTIEAAANLLRQRGVEEIWVFATHPVFSDHAPSILQESKVEKVFVTDSIYIPKEKHFPKLEIISVADMIAEAIANSKL